MRKKVLSIVSALLLCVNIFIPCISALEPDAVFTKVSSASEITEGKYVIYGISSDYKKAMSDSVSGGHISGTDVTVNDDKIVNPDNKAVYEVKSMETAGQYSLKNMSTGKYVDIISSKTSGLSFVSSPAGFTFKDGNKSAGDIVVTATNPAANLRGLSIYQTDFRPYADTTRNTLYMYKLTEGAAPDKPQFPTTTTPTENPDIDVTTISQARQQSAGTKVAVKGVVTFVDNQNYYVEDSTGAVVVRLASADSSIVVGKTLQAVGTLGEFNSLTQINVSGSSDYSVSDGTLPQPQEITINEIGESFEGKYVTIKGAKITSLDSYRNPTIAQGDKTIVIYRCAVIYSVGDTVDVKAVVSQYKDTYQLRATPENVVKVTGTETPVDPDTKPVPEPTVTDDPISDNDEIFKSGAINIKQALANGKTEATGFTVVGQLTYKATSYNNPVIEDVIDGKVYSLYVFGALPDGAKVGDIIKFNNAKYSVYNGMPELSGADSTEIVKTGIKAIEPAQMTLSEIKSQGTSIVGRHVKVKNVTIGVIQEKSMTVSDSTGSMNIYKQYTLPEGVGQGDKIDLFAMVACYNTTIQLYTGDGAYVIADDNKAPVIIFSDAMSDAKVNKDYTVSAEVKDPSGLKSVSVEINMGTDSKSYDMVKNADTGKYEYTITADKITSEVKKIDVKITATDNSDNKNVATSETKSITVNDIPQIEVVSPKSNSQTGDNKKPVFEVKVTNGGTNPTVNISIENNDYTMVSDGTSYKYTPSTDLTDGKKDVTVKVSRADGTVNSISWKFVVGKLNISKYFGQFHSHTNFSDGSGSLQSAIDYVNNIPDYDYVDFASVTDHSNYFDTTSAANPADALNDASLMTADSTTKWNEYNRLIGANNADSSKKLIMPGFEMTWSGGPGHINTFNSKGIITRNDKTLNNKTNDSGMKKYYETLIKNTDPLANLSQFNHPGTTFGNFSDFAYYTPAYDAKMDMVEVGNGEGAIGSGGYFPSFQQYTLALDKGWHVGPTNNQDNHKGKWGNANTARSVIYAENLTEEGVLSAISKRAMYATEDKNLSIEYTLNGQMMGSIISDVPSSLDFDIHIADPDNSDKISKVEIVRNNGRVAKSKTFDSNTADWTFSDLPVVAGYYYVRVTEADKNIAVTAPVWIGSAHLVGINSVEIDTKIPVTGEQFKVTTKLFNSETEAKTVKSITYKLGDTVLSAKDVNASIESNGTYTDEFMYTPDKAGTQGITVEAVIEDNTYTSTQSFTVRDSDKLIYVGIDASKYNEYVNGNYKDSMGNFINMGTDYGIRVSELKTTDDLISATKNPKYKMLILTPPTRRNGNQLLADYKNWSDEEIKAIADFAKAGNTVVVTGWGDYYEHYTGLSQSDHMAAQQNKILEAIGSKLRISDDELKDEVNNGGQSQRLYLKEINKLNKYMAKVADSQVYSNYGGSTIYAVGNDNKPVSVLPDTVSPMVYGFETSISSDDDSDSYAGITIPKYDNKYLSSASEEVKYDNGLKANIIVAGSVFMSNFEIQTQMDNYNTPEYSNYTIAENMFKIINPVVISDIKDVQSAKEGESFTVRGTLTTDVSGYNKDTAFFDSAYMQDKTAGINLFPIDGNYKAGTELEVSGETSSYNGERQLKVTKIIVINDKGTVPDAIKVSCKDVNDYKYLGSLVSVSGTITRIKVTNNLPESIYVKDDSGEETRVFIDGYITKDKVIPDLKVGNKIEAKGLSSKDTSYEDNNARIRISDRDNVVCQKVSSTDTPTEKPDEKPTEKPDEKPTEKPVVKPVDDTKDNIDKINQSAKDMLDKISKGDKSQIVKDKDFIDSINKLDDLLISANENISVTYNNPEVDNDVNNNVKLPAKPVTFKGLVLAVTGNDISDENMKFAVDVKQKKTDDNSIDIEITPELNGMPIKNSDIKSPVTIKLYLNDNFNSDTAVVKHILDNKTGKLEIIEAKVNKDSNGKYIEFTVVQFSRFIITEKHIDNKVDSPKTGFADNLIVISILSVLLASSIYVTRKKLIVKK